MTHIRSRAASAALVALLSGTALFGVVTSGASAAPAKLVGVFKISAGVSAGSAAKGSYFRMIQPGGKVGSGPFVPNPSSSASNKTYTLFKPGVDGGLSTVRFQPAPAHPFDKSGNALADRIVRPVGFAGKKFSVTTSAKDPQSGKAAKLPVITNDGKGHLTGNLSAFAAWWNNQKFNQGSPKPGGSKPGLTAGPTGTYNAKTHVFTLNWWSAIVGGPFNGFTGQWHLQGTFVPKS
jgi:hypothetical protein